MSSRKNFFCYRTFFFCLLVFLSPVLTWGGWKALPRPLVQETTGGKSPALFKLSPPTPSPSTGSGKVKPPAPLTHQVKKGETMWAIARRYGIDLTALMAANPTVIPTRMPVGTVLRLPTTKTDLSSRKGSRTFIWPLAGRITSRYGWRRGRMHRGLDIAAPAGTPVRATAAGHVLFAGWQRGYGLVVILSHPDGRQTVYGHNAALLVKPGQWVAAGEVLAKVGATGNATGPHLHFEVRTAEGYLDPLRVLP